MEFHGLIHTFPKEVKAVIVAFIVTLSIGFYGGMNFVKSTTSMSSSGIETHYNGNEDDEDAEIMKFKKSKGEILTVVHNHILSLSVIFFLLAFLVSITSINKKLKYFLMVEPFFSLVLTFGGIYLLWSGIIWFKYVIVFSGVLMTLSFIASTLSITYDILFSKK